VGAKENAVVIVFGSRIDNSLKGGDIDFSHSVRAAFCSYAKPRKIS